MTARDELMYGLWDNLVANEKNRLIDAFAHELAEKIRAELPDPNPLASVFKPYAAHLAADLIDPYTHNDQPQLR